jgi:hypothetical protein
MHITKKYIHLNSRFRDKMTEDPWNFLYTLPFFIENVVAIRLNSIEMVPGNIDDGLPGLTLDPTSSKADKYFFFCLDDYTNHEIDKHIVCLDRNRVLNEKVLGKIQIYDTDNAKIISSDFDCKENVLERLYQNRYNLQRFRVKLINEYGDALKVNGNDLNRFNFSFTLEVDVIDGI